MSSDILKIVLGFPFLLSHGDSKMVTEHMKIYNMRKTTWGYITEVTEGGGKELKQGKLVL